MKPPNPFADTHILAEDAKQQPRPGASVTIFPLNIFLLYSYISPTLKSPLLPTQRANIMT